MDGYWSYCVWKGDEMECRYSLEVAGIEGFLSILPMYLDVGIWISLHSSIFSSQRWRKKRSLPKFIQSMEMEKMREWFTVKWSLSRTLVMKSCLDCYVLYCMVTVDIYPPDSGSNEFLTSLFILWWWYSKSAWLDHWSNPTISSRILSSWQYVCGRRR